MPRQQQQDTAPVAEHGPGIDRPAPAAHALRADRSGRRSPAAVGGPLARAAVLPISVGSRTSSETRARAHARDAGSGHRRGRRHRRTARQAARGSPCGARRGRPRGGASRVDDLDVEVGQVERAMRRPQPRARSFPARERDGDPSVARRRAAAPVGPAGDSYARPIHASRWANSWASTCSSVERRSGPRACMRAISIRSSSRSATAAARADGGPRRGRRSARRARAGPPDRGCAGAPRRAPEVR